MRRRSEIVVEPAAGPGDARARIFLGAIKHLATVAMQIGAPRLQYAKLALLEAGRAHAVRRLSRACVVLKAVDKFAIAVSEST